MPLPTSREQNFAVGSILEPSTMNAIQDAIIGIVAGTIALKRGTLSRRTAALLGQAVTGTTTAWSTTLGFWHGQPGAILQIPMVLDQGDRLLSCVGRVIQATDPVSMRVWRVNATTNSPSRTQLGSTQTSAGGGVYESLSVSGLTDDVPAGQVSYYAEFTVGGSGGGAQVLGITYDTSRP